MIKLQEDPTGCMRPLSERHSTALSDLDSWHKVEEVKPDPNRYGLGTNLYDNISAHPKIDSGYK
jgi:hypothetical protein